MTKAKTRDRQPADGLPVARVCVEVGLPHLDRLFDYQVPSELDGVAQPGTRVKVRFSGKLVDGWLVERVAVSDHPKLAWLEKVVSAEPVLRPQVVTLAREIAQRYAGSLGDVLRLAVPPRQAAVEKEAHQAAAVEPPELPEPVGWSRYPAGAAFLSKLAEGEAPRAVWNALPGEDWPSRVAEAIAATLHSGRGAVAVVADARDLSRLDASLTTLIGAGHHVALSAALGPAERYRRFLKLSRGEARAVIGTRAAAFAPVERLGLVAIWDDGDDVHAEPRAPYPHARKVLLTRSVQEDAAVLIGGFARTAEAQQLLATGWAREVAATRDTIRLVAAEVQPADDNQLARDPAAASARLPSVAWNAARAAIKAGTPVLVQVPRRGYVPAVSCQDCRERARCPHCSGPLILGGAGATASCRWCARPAVGFTCPACGGRRLRAAITGVGRTAEEMGRALPDVPVLTSGGANILDRVPDGPALVLSTPGAEPVADGGYGAVLLLDSWALLTRSDLRAGEETARRWFQAAALARPGGKVVVVADGSLAPVQALIRWDPGWLAERELAERRALRFPPAAQLASLTGVSSAVNELLEACVLPPGAEVLGPIPVSDGGASARRRAATSAHRGGSDASRSARGRGDDAGLSGRRESGVDDTLGHGESGDDGMFARGESGDGGAYAGEEGGEVERMLVRVRRSDGPALAVALHAAAGVRSARKAADPVRIQLDPQEL